MTRCGDGKAADKAGGSLLFRRAERQEEYNARGINWNWAYQATILMISEELQGWVSRFLHAHFFKPKRGAPPVLFEESPSQAAGVDM